MKIEIEVSTNYDFIKCDERKEEFITLFGLFRWIADNIKELELAMALGCDVVLKIVGDTGFHTYTIEIDESGKFSIVGEPHGSN